MGHKILFLINMLGGGLRSPSAFLVRTTIMLIAYTNRGGSAWQVLQMTGPLIVSANCFSVCSISLRVTLCCICQSTNVCNS